MMSTLNKLIAYVKAAIVGLCVIVGVIVGAIAAALICLVVTIALNVGFILMVGVIDINDNLTRVYKSWQTN